MMLKDIPMERKLPMEGEESRINTLTGSFECEMDGYLVDRNDQGTSLGMPYLI